MKFKTQLSRLVLCSVLDTLTGSVLAGVSYTVTGGAAVFILTVSSTLFIVGGCIGLFLAMVCWICEGKGEL